MEEAMNIFVIAVLIVLFCNVVNGFHKGMVKTIISFISLIFLSALAVLLAAGLHSYLTKDYVQLVIAVILLCVLKIIHHLLGVVYLPAKLVSKLPVVKTGNKLLGIVVGVLETVLILWTVYALIMLFGLGDIGTQILGYVAENPVLEWFYEHNYLLEGVQKLNAQILLLGIT